MMHGWYGGWGWLEWSTMTVVMIGFWALVIWLFVSLTRSTDGPASRGECPPTPDQVLAHRLAAGEIDDNEYRGRLEALHPVKTGGP